VMSTISVLLEYSVPLFRDKGAERSPHLRVLKLVAHLNVWVWIF